MEIKAIQMPKLSQFTYDCLDLPQIYSEQSNFSIIEKMHHLQRLRDCAEKHLNYLLKEKNKIIITVEKQRNPLTNEEFFIFASST